MHNVWSELAKMRRDFPTGSMVVVDDDVEDMGEDISGLIAKVQGYLIEEGMLSLVTESGRDFTVYPDEVERYWD